MPICNDDKTTYLRRLGYNVITLPRSGIRPLTVLFVAKGRRLQELGWLPSIWTSTVSVPEPKTGDNVANVAGKSTDNIGADVGLDILSNLTGALGFDPAKAAMKFSGARSFRFHFRNIERVRIDPFDLGTYVTAGELASENPFVKKYLAPGKDVFVITEVLRSKEFGVSASSSRDGSAGFEIPALEDLIDVQAKLEARKVAESTVDFVGAEALPFAFVAAKLSYDGNVWGTDGFPQPGAVSMTPKEPREFAEGFAVDRGNGAVIFGDTGTTDIDEPA